MAPLPTTGHCSSRGGRKDKGKTERGWLGRRGGSNGACGWDPAVLPPPGVSVLFLVAASLRLAQPVPHRMLYFYFQGLLCSPQANSKEGMRQLTYLLQHELLIFWGNFFAEIHDEHIHSCIHSYAGLRLVGVIAYFILGCVLEKLKMEQPTCIS